LKPKILVTSPYPQFTQLITRVSQSKKLKIKTIEAVLEEAAELVCEEVNNFEYEVVVSRGGTAAAIKKVVDIPVVTAEFNDFDLLRSLWEARKFGDKIAYMASAYRELYEFDELIEMIGVEVEQYTYRNSQEFSDKIRKASQDQFKVLISGAEWGQKLAEGAGMKGMVIYSSLRSVTQALERAEEVIAIRQRDKEHSRRLITMIQAVNDGVVCIDATSKVLFINEMAENLLGLKGSQVSGKATQKANKKLLELMTLSSGPDQKCLINGTDLVVNRAEVVDKKEYFGVVFTLQKISQLQQLEQKIRKESHRKGLIARFTFDDIQTREKIMLNIIEKAKNFSQVNSTVLIIGESGSGKELFAQSIHRASACANGPFVAVNCAALPEDLLESELFGFEEGAFTGARKGGKPGLFELAHGGTIFLDEIGSISLNVQARLLRVLQEREVMRIGGESVVPVNVRCIAATNSDLQSLVRDGRFRRDLYFRLNVLKLELPLLKDRPEDILLIAEYFLAEFSRRFNKKVKEIPRDLLAWMKSYDWPGNIRELQNFIERLVILAGKGTLNKKWIQQLIEEADEGSVQENRSNENHVSIKIGTLEYMEKQLIDAASERAKGSRSDLARMLGISRTTLWKKLNSDNTPEESL